MRAVLKLATALCGLAAAPQAAQAVVKIDVDLAAQTMRVKSSSGEVHDWRISSGRAGHVTPSGLFRPRAMFTMVHSAKYGNAPMPHSIFFYGSYAIHGTTAVAALGRPASHGCIRIGPANAARLFALVKAEGARIRIGGAPWGAAAADTRAPGATALGYAPRGHARTLEQWARNPTGPR